jgi:hypothetical protein
MIERIAKRYRFIEENPEVLGEPLSEQDLKKVYCSNATSVELGHI